MQKHNLNAVLTIPQMKRLAHYVGHCLMVASLAYIVITLARQSNNLPHIDLRKDTVLALFIAVGYFSALPLVNAQILRLLLLGSGTRLSVIELFIITGKANISKYLPGNVFQYVSRFVLSKRYGIPNQAVAISTAIEIGLSLVSACLVAVFEFVLNPKCKTALLNSTMLPEWILKPNAPLVIPVIAIAVGCWWMTRKSETWLLLRPYLTVYRITPCIAMYLASFLAMGFVAHTLVESIFKIPNPLPWYRFVSSFALAWLIGYVVPGAPGGLGIREFFLIKLLGPSLGEGCAASLSLILRFLNIIGDLIAYLAAEAIARTKRGE